MKVFHCENCDQLVFFENTVCVRCHQLLGFTPLQMRMQTFTTEVDDGTLKSVTDHNRYRYCENNKLQACNWVLPIEDSKTFCKACRYNFRIPALNGNNLVLWRKIEIAKHRLFYSLLRWNLDVPPRDMDPERGLAFDFLEEFEGQQVSTGHAEGIITIDIAEADDSVRAKNRQLLNEPYRTLLGHFRHEIGHYLWNSLFFDQKARKSFRKYFGDESADYQMSLEAYYQRAGKSEDWRQSHISEYATSHPWEDWAETWAHYVHMVDTLETAFSTASNYMQRIDQNADLHFFDPYCEPDFEKIIGSWFPLTHTVNSINRSMGHEDLYPFVLTDGVIEKLRFVHTLVQEVVEKGFILPPAENRSGPKPTTPASSQ